MLCKLHNNMCKKLEWDQPIQALQDTTKNVISANLVSYVGILESMALAFHDIDGYLHGIIRPCGHKVWAGMGLQGPDHNRTLEWRETGVGSTTPLNKKICISLDQWVSKVDTKKNTVLKGQATAHAEKKPLDSGLEREDWASQFGELELRFPNRKIAIAGISNRRKNRVILHRRALRKITAESPLKFVKISVDIATETATTSNR